MNKISIKDKRTIKSDHEILIELVNVVNELIDERNRPDTFVGALPLEKAP